MEDALIPEQLSFVSLDGGVDSDRAVTIGTVSWSVPRRGHELLGAHQFLTTLEQVGGLDLETDLLLASGRTLSTEPAAGDVLSRTSGTPVLFEVVNPQGNARWLLAHEGASGRSEVLRSSQVLFQSGDSQGAYERLVAEVIAGHGVIRLAGRGLTLVLLICGENNALGTDGRDLSALYYPRAGLEKALGDRWVALNPAHAPYWPQIRSKGFAKVGKVGGSGETMVRPVARKGRFSDGTMPPAAFVHCNNFYADEPRTRAYASVAFNRTGRLTPRSSREGIVAAPDGEEIQWLFSAFEIPS